MPARMKTCSVCGRKRHLSEYYRNGTRGDGLDSACKTCARKAVDAAQALCRDAVFGHYGRVCACCGGTEHLSLDHVHGNGKRHRKLLRVSGISFYTWLASHEFPRECEPGGEFELQVLCLTCNFSKSGGDHCHAHCREHEECRNPVPRKRPSRTLAEIAREKAARDFRIRELRGEGWTQQRIADEVGCSQPTVATVLRMIG